MNIEQWPQNLLEILKFVKKTRSNIHMSYDHACCLVASSKRVGDRDVIIFPATGFSGSTRRLKKVVPCQLQVVKSELALIASRVWPHMRCHICAALKSIIGFLSCLFALIIAQCCEISKYCSIFSICFSQCGKYQFLKNG